jgi:hypothetical protein
MGRTSDSEGRGFAVRSGSVKVGFLMLLAVVALLAWSGSTAVAAEPCTSGRGQAATGPCKKAKAVAANRTGVPRSEWSTSCFPETARRYECTVYSSSRNCTGGMELIRRDGRWRARNVQIDCRRY